MDVLPSGHSLVELAQVLGFVAFVVLMVRFRPLRFLLPWLRSDRHG